MGYSLVVINDYQPGSFLDSGVGDLHSLGDRLRGNDGRTALPDFWFNLITAMGGKL